MKREFVSKIMSAILLGGLFGWYIHFGLVTGNLRGREAFMAYQSHRFDLTYATPSPALSNVISAALLAVGACVVYEFVAYCLSAAMKVIAPEKGAA
jgi:hypothetical protein